MSLDRLANRVMTIAALGVVVFLGGVVASVDYVRRGLNHQAQQRSIGQVSQRLAALHGQTRLMAQDYNNWSSVHAAAMRDDVIYIADNYGVTAINGDIFDQATMFDGPFETPIRWVSGGSRRPHRPYLTKSVMDAVRNGVDALVQGNRPTLDYMTITDDTLFFHSASRLLPDTPGDLALTKLVDTPVAIISRALRGTELFDIATDLELSELRLSSENHGPDVTILPITGLARKPIAYLSWHSPRSGDQLVRTVSPILAIIILIVVVLTMACAKVLQSAARTLVAREAKAAYLARTDILTALPNRLAFLHHLTQKMSVANAQVAIILIDLDGFKTVNDLVGHAGGDAVIRHYAERISRVASQDRFIGRIGGDEFVVVVTDQTNAARAAKEAAEEIINLASLSYIYQGCRFELAASYGIAARRDSDKDGEELLGRADRAMYHAKCRSGSQVSVYHPDMDRHWDEERSTGRALRTALQDGTELSVVYQPIVDSRSGAVTRLEALARWHSDVFGTVGPNIFIPIAERTGLIIKLGEFVLKEACKAARRYPNLKISVNLSPTQLLGDNFVPRTMRILGDNGVHATQIEFELTEVIAVRDFDAVSAQLQALRGFGFTTALDDFGAGFSSIGYLRRMPFDTLKIDRSLVSGLAAQDISDIVRPIVDIGHSLNKTVTAEGIESEEEAKWLRRAGCDHLQGYWIGRPSNLDNLKLPEAETSVLAAE